MEHGKNGIDNRSKVRYLSDGIKTSSLDSVKTRIMSDASLRQDFAACVTLYKDFVKQDTQNKKNELGIAAVGADLNKKVSFANKLEDRFYLPEEWKDLSDSDKDKVRAMRATRKNKAGYANWRGGKKDEKKYKSKVAKLEKKIKHQKRQLSALNTASKDDGSGNDSDSSSGGGEDGKTSNAKHSALTRQKRRKK